MSSPAIQFDTHKFIKRLTAHGFSEEQAEALAEEQVNLLNDNLATKEDIAKIESNLRLEMANIESNLKLGIAKLDTKIEATRAGLLKWIIGLSIAQISVIISIANL